MVSSERTSRCSLNLGLDEILAEAAASPQGIRLRCVPSSTNIWLCRVELGKGDVGISFDDATTYQCAVKTTSSQIAACDLCCGGETTNLGQILATQIRDLEATIQNVINPTDRFDRYITRLESKKRKRGKA